MLSADGWNKTIPASQFEFQTWSRKKCKKSALTMNPSAILKDNESNFTEKEKNSSGKNKNFKNKKDKFNWKGNTTSSSLRRSKNFKGNVKIFNKDSIKRSNNLKNSKKKTKYCKKRERQWSKSTKSFKTREIK